MKHDVNRSSAAARLLLISLIALVLPACASGPTTVDADAFSLLKEGSIPPGSVQVFADCLLDGFDKAHFMLSNITSRQQRRTDSYRVETLSGGSILLVSAAAFDNGHVALSESKSAALVNTSGERDAFNQCLSKFSIVQ